MIISLNWEIHTHSINSRDHFNTPVWINPLPSKFFFESIFDIYPKMDSYRLPTHRHSSHRKLLSRILPYFKIEILANVGLLDQLRGKGWPHCNVNGMRSSTKRGFVWLLIPFKLFFFCVETFFWKPFYVQKFFENIAP